MIFNGLYPFLFHNHFVVNIHRNKQVFLIFISTYGILPNEHSVGLIDKEREHGRCAALHWLLRVALGSIAYHALFSIFLFLD